LNVRSHALWIALVAALVMAGCSSTHEVRRPAPDPAARPAPAPISDTLKVDEVAGPDASVVIDQGPIAIRKVPPAYPDEARSKGVQGLLRVQVLIGTQGRVEDTRMVQSIPLLDEAAMAAVRQWEFKPAMAQGKPVPVWVTVPVRFTLN
jgi:TonB family protein